MVWNLRSFISYRYLFGLDVPKITKTASKILQGNQGGYREKISLFKVDVLKIAWIRRVIMPSDSIRGSGIRFASLGIDIKSALKPNLERLRDGKPWALQMRGSRVAAIENIRDQPETGLPWLLFLSWWSGFLFRGLIRGIIFDHLVKSHHPGENDSAKVGEFTIGIWRGWILALAPDAIRDSPKWRERVFQTYYRFHHNLLRRFPPNWFRVH